MNDRLMGIICGGVIGFTLHMLLPKYTPQAIEVYQGKTTLEYKIIDGEVIDSCVVFKNK